MTQIIPAGIPGNKHRRRLLLLALFSLLLGGAPLAVAAPPPPEVSAALKEAGIPLRSVAIVVQG